MRCETFTPFGLECFTGAQARQPLTRSSYLQELALQALSRKGRRRNPWLHFHSPGMWIA
jgi:hypothetical protein